LYIRFAVLSGFVDFSRRGGDGGGRGGRGRGGGRGGGRGVAGRGNNRKRAYGKSNDPYPKGREKTKKTKAILL